MTSKVNRRKVLQGLAVAPLAARGWWGEAAEASSTLFVGTQTKGGSKGIYAYRWDAAKGEVKQIGLAAEAEYPTFLAVSPDGKYLYAANEVDSFNGVKGGGVSSFAVDAKAGKLTAINAVSAKGTGTCHVSVDKTGQAVFCANYSGGSAASFHVKADGGLTEAVSDFQYSGHGPKPDQEMAHAHRATVTPDNKILLVNDLGLDCIHIYKLDAATAKLTPHDPAGVEVGAGCGTASAEVSSQRQVGVLRAGTVVRGRGVALGCAGGVTDNNADAKPDSRGILGRRRLTRRRLCWIGRGSLCMRRTGSTMCW